MKQAELTAAALTTLGAAGGKTAAVAEGKSISNEFRKWCAACRMVVS
jgi:hypothetical protein